MALVTGYYAVHGVAPTGTFQAQLVDAGNTVTVLNRSTTEIYFTRANDGATPNTPAVSGVDSFPVAGVAGASTTVQAGVPPTTVYLTSSGTAAFSVYGGQVEAVVER